MFTISIKIIAFCDIAIEDISQAPILVININREGI